VEFPYAGGWYPGYLLGWRHDGPDCRVRVQCVIGGLRRTTWMSLADLRLPEPAASSAEDDARSTPQPTASPFVPRPRTGGWSLTPA
jgi:hypothetical protein